MSQLGIPGLFNPSVFERLVEKFGYGIIYQEYDPCPAKPGDNCKICGGLGQRPQFHPRPIPILDIEYDAVRREDGKPEIVLHRFLTGPLELKSGEGEPYIDGLDYQLEGRTIHWLDTGSPPRGGASYKISYRAYQEGRAHIQHVVMDYAGGKRQGERTLNLPYTALEQGLVAMTIPASQPGYMLKSGDVFYPVDSRMPFTHSGETLKKDHLRSRHRFVLEIVRAYGLNGDRNKEIPIEGVTYNTVTQHFILPENLDPRIEEFVILYIACPAYTVYLDLGEFRHPQGQDHARLTLLSRLEITR